MSPKTKRRRQRRKIVRHIVALVRRMDSIDVDHPAPRGMTRAVTKALQQYRLTMAMLELQPWLCHPASGAALAIARPTL